MNSSPFRRCFLCIHKTQIIFTRILFEYFSHIDSIWYIFVLSFVVNSSYMIFSNVLFNYLIYFHLCFDILAYILAEVINHFFYTWVLIFKLLSLQFSSFTFIILANIKWIVYINALFIFFDSLHRISWYFLDTLISNNEQLNNIIVVFKYLHDFLSS